ncbi:flagellar hook-basal body protein [Bacillus luteolus]|uniref:Flagellar hook-basal body protein n=1 Tax=Litchfieldia luteola TaxID=682179 RepID=A0ABR9QFK5_9BACI|nr:flagellar hook-basal body protein [Cytobacillus luteolus]MBE4907277.1 flagellar hook-basal body protein [Cytobacillus luteolus]MBP1943242.1 flagellar basal-body rod protein FlgG [Cytobacillus luteolus]
MLRGLYSAASGMLTQQRRSEILSNNMANSNTPGFKADQSSLRSFPEMLIHSLESVKTPLGNGKNIAKSTQIGSLNTGVYIQDATALFKQGDIRETGRATDIALVDGNIPENGALLFSVENSNGELRYTRNGNFTQDAAGFLTTNEGYYVLDNAGNRIQIQNADFKVTSNGTIIDGNIEVAQLNIAFAENANDLIKEGNGLFGVEGADLPSAVNNPDISYTLSQGFVERSNVDVSQTMTDLMMAYRAFEANQKILQAYDRSLEKAVNEIGRLR